MKGTCEQIPFHFFLKFMMLTYAPWHILESVDKKYARIKALKIVIKELEKALERV